MTELKAIMGKPGKISTAKVMGGAVLTVSGFVRPWVARA
jgi:hypothetical protein